MDAWLKYPVPSGSPHGPWRLVERVGSTVPGMARRKAETGGAPARARAHLVLLLETVALRTLHLRDVLKQIRHTDGRVELPRLIGHVGRLPLLVSVGLHHAAGVASHRVGFV